MAIIIKRKLITLLDEIINDTPLEQKIKQCDLRISELQQTVDAASYEASDEIGFERMCLFISQELHKDAKTMTVMEYETAVKILTDRQRELEKHSKR